MAWAGGASLWAAAGCDSGLSLPFYSTDAIDHEPFLAPQGASVDLVSHVLNRIGYGPRPGDYARVQQMGVDAYIEEQLEPDAIDDAPCFRRVRRLETLDNPVGELFEYRDSLLLSELTRGTVLRAVYSRRQLHEVMVGFWTDHFNIDSSKGDCAWLKTADDREVIRRHALGSFPEMLRASLLSPAMLWYLDGRANAKRSPEDRPNENYARELLELHTLGVDGGYSQEDVMEAARCLTGWTVRSDGWFWKGRVEFHRDAHDNGEKRVLGETIPAGGGKKDIDDLLDIITRQPSHARFIATKLCRKFISPTPSEQAIQATARTFSESDGNIRATLRTLFATADFRDGRPDKFKRPFRFLVSALRSTAAETDSGEALLEYLLRMGHSPFQYPTPDGYPDEAQPWMSTLLWRWHFALGLTENRIEGTTVDWVALRDRFGEEGVAAHMLQRKPGAYETGKFLAPGLGVALILSSPAFQRY